MDSLNPAFLNPALVVEFRVKLYQPLLATTLAGDPNEGVSFNYVPGSLLRGALIRQYCQREKIAQLDAADDKTQRLFFSGDTRFLNAYPQQEHQQKTYRLLPVPRSLQYPKGQPENLTDWAMQVATAEDQQSDWKNVHQPFCWLRQRLETGTTHTTTAIEDDDFVEDGGFGEDEEFGEDGFDTQAAEQEIFLYTPKRQIWVHTARTRRFGRAMPQRQIRQGEMRGAVYRYDALAPDQTFCALIICRTSADATDLRILLPEAGIEVMLGGARSAGYGKAKLYGATLGGETALKQQTPENVFWRECSGPKLSDDVAPGSELRLTLLSDCLLRDANGQGCVSPQVIESALRLRLGLVTLLPQKTFLAATLTGGFNSTWGLPLPQLPAVAMGSVVTLRAETDISPEKLQKLEEDGIGERRAEGFGRLAVNWHTAMHWEAREFDAEAMLMPLKLDDANRAIAQKMVERMLHRRLDERVLELAYDTDHVVVGLRSKAQVARLRAVIGYQLAQDKPSAEEVENFIASIRCRASARRQFERARRKHSNQPLLDWLETVLQCDAEQWNRWFNIDLAAMNANVPAIGAIPGVAEGVAASVTPELRTEYLLRLTDAVLARAVKDWHSAEAQGRKAQVADATRDEAGGET